MPASLTFTNPILRPPLASCQIVHAETVDDTAKSITLVLKFTDADGHDCPDLVTLKITNQGCDTFGFGGPVYGTAAPALAFDQVLGAYFAAGNTAGMLTKLGQLGIIPAGTAA